MGITTLSKKSRGFTLIEVLVALMILAIALLGFRQGQSSTVKLAVQSEKQAQALTLAQKQMTETEIMLRKKNFQGMPEEEKGEFKDEAFKEYKWIRKLEKVDLGCFMPKQKGKDANEQGVFSIFDKLFDNSVRKIRITVEWSDGKQTRSKSLTQLYVRFEDIANLM